MISNEEQVRAAIAEQAGDWLVANDEGPLSSRDCEALADWLKSSPLHVEEFLGVSVVARDLRQAGADPDFSIDAVLAGARTADTSVQSLRPRRIPSLRPASSRRWFAAAVAMAALCALSVGLILFWTAGPIAPTSAPGPTMAAVEYQTRHGEQRTVRLADDSILHLNTDSAVSVRYGKTERVVMLTSGEADFEVAHESGRDFRVFAGAAEVIAIGTNFDVRLQDDSTVVSVVEGRVNVGPSPVSGEPVAGSSQKQPVRFVQLVANQQLRVVRDQWPATAAGMDAQRITAWLHRKIVFDQEPLERVAAEFNRYGALPIEIVTPELRSLQISGVFATDGTEAFIAFLRSLKGVRVEVTPTRIRVSRNLAPAAPDYT